MAGEQTRFATGNKAASKYSIEDAREIFRETLDDIKADPKIRFLNTALAKRDRYAQLLKYLASIYAEDEEVVVTGQKIESLLLSRLAEGAMSGDTKEATSIFIMKTVHGLKETSIVETRSPELEASSEQELLANLDTEDMLAMKQILDRAEAKRVQQGTSDQQHELL